MIMTLVSNQEINFKSVQDAMEQASLFFYRIEKLANSTIFLNEFKDGDFQNPLYKQDCIHYQLENIRDLAKQYECLFDELTMSFGRPIDLQLKGLAELLPENSATGVFSSTHPIP
jgi:hypothetical protein